MAKIAYSKLDLKVNDDIAIISHVTSKDEMIEFEVKKYLPIEEKMEMISRIINLSVDDNGFYNPVRLQIYTTIEIVFAYTNLNFTTKQKENLFKLYDQLISSGIFDKIQQCICEKDLDIIRSATISTIDNIYKYKNSVMGIINNVVNDYESLNLDASDIQASLADPENLQLLKSILSKLG